MPNFEKDQWRLLLLYCLIPVVLCFLCSFFVMESGRFLLTNKKFEDAKKFFFRLAQLGNVPFNDEMMKEIVEESINNPVNKYESSFALLINKKFLKLSVLTWIIWWVGSFSLYSTIYMLPQILDNISVLNVSIKGNIFKDIIISNLISLPKSLLSGFLSNVPFLGRKYTMFWSFVLISVLEFLLVVDVLHVHIYSGFIKLLGGLVLGVIKVYSTEAYPTKIRGIGYGTGHSISRFAGCSVPFICEYLRGIFGIMGPSYGIFVLSLLTAFCCYLLPFETLGRALDLVDEEDIIELEKIEKLALEESKKKLLSIRI